ncbi:MAG TPA: hypothetical protein VKX33_08135 [Cyclobacteriaceae bacterium]|nr:hypothetical protein [Cyclobacteriaceae bacterium]
MKNLIIIISIVGLLLTLVPSFLVFLGLITLETGKTLMLIGTLVWFITAPSWMNKKEEGA